MFKFYGINAFLLLIYFSSSLFFKAYPSSASTLHFEYYAENVDEKSHKKTSNSVIAIHVDNIDKVS